MLRYDRQLDPKP